MFGSITFDIAVHYIILVISLNYLYKAVKQIITKDIDFYKQEIYTDESVEKWAVADGLLKCATSLVCLVYSLLYIMAVYDGFWYVPVALAANMMLYLLLYRKILIRKEQS